MSEHSRIRSATEEDLDRLFGSGRFMIGFPVRPQPEDDEQEHAEAEQQLAEDSEAADE